jgi:hypothetical protein
MTGLRGERSHVIGPGGSEKRGGVSTPSDFPRGEPLRA